jgi:hypothetical protein
MKNMSQSELIATLAAMLAGSTNGEAVSAEPLPEATSAPSWLTQAKVNVKPAAKAKAKAPATKRYEVHPSTFTDPKGGKHTGVAIMKFYGDEPDRRRPHGKFLTLDEYNAVKAHRG